MKISIIIPVYFESTAIEVAYQTIKNEILKHDIDYEIIFIDDGSTDDSYNFIEKISKIDAKIKAIKFTTNCGSHIAIRAGLEYATGDCACFIACDMQEPPYLIYEMVTKLNSENNIIWAVRNSRKDSFISNIFSNLFYFFARLIVTKNIPPTGASMFLVSRKVLNALKKYNERTLTLEGLFATMGFKSDFVYYEREERKIGKSKWTLSKKIKLFIDFFVAYSATPIRFVSIMGIVFSLSGLFWTAYIILRSIFVGDLASGWPTLISILLVGFGITNISLGIVAEYLWRTLDETRKRPKYIIEKTINISNE